MVEDEIDNHMFLFSRNPLPNFFVFAGVQHDFVWVTWSHTRMTFGPIVRNSVSKYVAIAVECTRRNGTRGCVESCHASS